MCQLGTNLVTCFDGLSHSNLHKKGFVYLSFSLYKCSAKEMLYLNKGINKFHVQYVITRANKLILLDFLLGLFIWACFPESNLSGLLTPESPLITASTTPTTPFSLKHVNLTYPVPSTQVINQPSKDTPSSLVISSTPSPLALSPSFPTSSSLITILYPY